MYCSSKNAAACPGSKIELFAAIRRGSVPVRLIGGQVRILLHANDLAILDGHQQAARYALRAEGPAVGSRRVVIG